MHIFINKKSNMSVFSVCFKILSSQNESTKHRAQQVPCEQQTKWTPSGCPLMISRTCSLIFPTWYHIGRRLHSFSNIRIAQIIVPLCSCNKKVTLIYSLNFPIKISMKDGKQNFQETCIYIDPCSEQIYNKLDEMKRDSI